MPDWYYTGTVVARFCYCTAAVLVLYQYYTDNSTGIDAALVYCAWCSTGRDCADTTLALHRRCNGIEQIRHCAS